VVRRRERGRRRATTTTKRVFGAVTADDDDVNDGRFERTDKTKNVVVRVDDSSALTRCARALADGGVCAVPTDTIYGFAACAKSARGVNALYEIKGRAADVPLAIAVADAEDVGAYGECEHLAEGLLARLLPGPTTVLLRRRQSRATTGVAPELNPGVELIGVRVPASEFVRSLCRAHGGAIALTSANKSGETSTTAVEEFQELWSKCDVVVDGGRIPTARSGSTIVDLSSRDGDYRIVRVGERCDELERVLVDEFALQRRTPSK
jgi:tRNA threonylcarbamoyl adenosine modification protein (Sua5/YciO/YrdC/YwlC family)